MANTAALLPQSAESVSESPWSDNAWVNPTYIYGAGEAEVSAATFDAGDQTYVLKAYNFDFSGIPDGSSIQGVICVVTGRYATALASIDLLQLLDTGRGKVGTNLCATPQALTVSSSPYTFGNSTNKWGNSLTAAWVKDPDFGVAIGCLAGGSGNNNVDVYIDSVTLQIYYTAPTAVSDNQPAYLKGRATITDNQPSYTKGKSTSLDNQPSYLNGSLPTATDHQPVYLKGKSTATDNQPVYVEGVLVLTDHQPAFMDTKASILDVVSSAGRIKYSGDASSYGRAKAKLVPFSDQEILLKFRFGSTSPTGIFRVFLRASDDWATLDSPTTGYEVEITDTGGWKLNRISSGSRTQIGSTVSWTSSTNWYWLKFNVVSKFVKAKIWQDGGSEPTWDIFVDDRTSGFTTDGILQLGYFRSAGGWKEMYVDSINLHASPKTNPYDNQPAYTKGGLVSTDNQFAFTQGKDTLSDNQLAYLNGSQPSIPVSDNIPAYTKGLATLSDNQTVYLSGANGITNNQSVYLLGKDTLSNNQQVYIRGRSSVNNIFNDSFIGTDDTFLEDYDSRWTPQGTTEVQKLVIESNGYAAIQTTGGQYYCFVPSDGSAINADQFSEVEVHLDSAKAIFGIVGVRCSVETLTGYYILFKNNYFECYKFINGTYTVLTNPAYETIVDGDRIAIRIVGNQLYYYLNGESLGGGQTDNSITSGYPGIGMHRNALDSISYLTNWRGGDVLSGEKLGAYLNGVAGITDNQSAFLQSKDTLIDNQPAYVEGENPVVPYSDNLPVYLIGKDTIVDNQLVYLRGYSTILDNQPVYLVGVAGASDNQPAFTQGQATLSDNQTSYTRGKDTLSDNISAYTSGFDTATNNIPVFLTGKSTASNNQPVYLAGGIVTSNNQLTFLRGRRTDTILEDFNKPDGDAPLLEGDFLNPEYIYIRDGRLYEYQESNVPIIYRWIDGQNIDVYCKVNDSDLWFGYLFINIEGSKRGIELLYQNNTTFLSISLSDDGGIVQSLDDYNIPESSGYVGLRRYGDRVVVYFKTNNGTTFDLFEYTRTWSSTGTKIALAPAYGFYQDDFGGGYVILNNQSIYLTGIDTISGNQPVFIQGKDTSIENIPAYLTGVVQITNNTPAYTKGKSTIVDNQPAFIPVFGEVTDNQSAYLKGRSTATDNQTAYLAGGLIVTDNQLVYTQGKDFITDNLPAYMAVIGVITSNQLSFLQGRDSLTHNQVSYLAGSLDVSDNISAYLNATGNTSSNNQPVYLSGIATITDNLLAFVQGKLTSSDSQAVYLNGKLGTIDNQSAYLIGKDTLQDNQTVYLAGGIIITNNQPVYVEGKALFTNHVSSYLRGKSTIEDNQLVYLSGKLGLSNNLPVYLTGRGGIVDNQRVFLKGGIIISDTLFAYMFAGGISLGIIHAYTRGIRRGTPHIHLEGQTDLDKNISGRTSTSTTLRGEIDKDNITGEM